MRESHLPELRPAAAALAALLAAAISSVPGADGPAPAWKTIAPFFSPPAELADDLGNYRSPLVFDDGRPVRSAEDWPKRRYEILDAWHRLLGPWPKLIDKPAVEAAQSERHEDYTRKKVRVEITAGQMHDGYLLVPDGTGPFPAVLVVFYDAETGAGLKADKPLLAFGHQLTRRGFVTLSIGWPRQLCDQAAPQLQPLSCLAYVAANCHTALAGLKEVDPARIGVTGHSFGGKWAMFAACLHEKFACGVWSDPGVAFDEARANVNYWEPWYLGAEAGVKRKAGIPTEANPRTGPYKTLIERRRDLHELQALMAPRPMLVSGGAEDGPQRWKALNHVLAVNRLLDRTDRVAMTNRKGHSPTEESNEQLYAFFEHFLKQRTAN